MAVESLTGPTPVAATPPTATALPAASAPAAPAHQDFKMPTLSGSPESQVDPLFGAIGQFDAQAQNPVDVYNAALDKLGITDARTRVTALRQALVNNQSLVDNLEPSINARTQGSLVDEAQRQKLLASEMNPLVASGKTLNDEFGAAQGDYQDILGEGKTQTDIESQWQTSQRQALMDRLKVAIDRTNDSEKKREWQAEYDRQVALDKQNQANSDRDYSLRAAAAARSGGGGGGGSSGGGGGGGGGSSSPTPAYGYKNGSSATGGYWFTDAAGHPISAQTYASLSGTNFNSLLQKMASSGDTGAVNALKSGNIGSAFTWR